MLDKGRPKGKPYPYLRNVNIRWDSIDTSSLLSMSFEDDELDRFGIRNGDVLVCEGGEPGRAAVWTHGETNLKYQKALHRVRLPEEVDPRWFVYQLMLDATTGSLSRNFTGSTIAHLPRERLIEYRLLIPPARVQQKTLEALDSYLTRLDDAVASLEQAQAKLKAYRASVLKTAVEGRLVPTEASLARAEKRDYEPADVLLARILKERRRRWEEAELARLKAAGKTPRDDKWKAKYEESVSPDTSAVPELPEGWCWASASALCMAIGDVDHKMPVAVAKGIPYVSTRDFVGFNDIDFVRAKRISWEAFEQLCRKIQPTTGDVLLSRYGTIGEVRRVEHQQLFQASYSIAILKPINSDVSAYLAYALRMPAVQSQMRRWTRASAQPDLGLTHIRQLAIPLPPLQEQERIRAEVDRLSSISSALADSVAVEEVRISRLRQSVLKWAFEGKLVDQDPNDEPAEKLLARIRAERAAVVPAKKSNGRRRGAA